MNFDKGSLEEYYKNKEETFQREGGKAVEKLFEDILVYENKKNQPVNGKEVKNGPTGIKTSESRDAKLLALQQETERLIAKKEGLMREVNEPSREEKLITNIATVLKIEKADLLKEKEVWLDNFVKFINKTNDQSYVEEINKNGGFNEEYFTEKCPNSMYGIADYVPFETKVDLFRSGKIKDPSIFLPRKNLREKSEELK